MIDSDDTPSLGQKDRNVGKSYFGTSRLHHLSPVSLCRHTSTTFSCSQTSTSARRCTCMCLYVRMFYCAGLQPMYRSKAFQDLAVDESNVRGSFVAVSPSGGGTPGTPYVGEGGFGAYLLLRKEISERQREAAAQQALNYRLPSRQQHYCELNTRRKERMIKAQLNKLKQQEEENALAAQQVALKQAKSVQS